MKQKMSVAALAIQLTAPVTVLLFLTVGMLQWLLIEPDFAGQDGYVASFEFGMEGSFTHLGQIGVYVLALLLMLCCISRKGDFSMTLNRLGVSRRTCTGIFGLVFTAWFLLYWIFQTAMMLLFYSRYAAGNNIPSMELSLACYGSKYLHQLIPLRDVWGYARNVLLALSFGMLISCICYHVRRTGNLLLRFLPLVWFLVCRFLTQQAPASQTEDIMLCVGSVVISTVCLCLAGRRGSNEEA